MDWNPVWSPDGRHLYFASDRGGSMNLWRVPIGEESGQVLGDPEPITTPSHWSGPFALSGDGKLLAFSALDRRSSISKVEFDPRSQMVTGPPVPVTPGTLMAANFFAVSPDGEWLAFRSVGRQEDLYLVRPDGTK